MWYLYILKCIDGKFYTGITTDIDKRVERHNQKKASKYTRMRTPVELVYQETHPDKSSALKREIQVKSFSRIQKIDLIKKEGRG